MAKTNNPKVGTIECPHCDQTRSVHVTAKGTYRGFLYSRCPSCPVKKFDAPRDDVRQALLRQNATFDAGFEHLANPIEQPDTKHDEPETPLNVQGSAVYEPEKPNPETLTPKPNRSRVGMVAALAGISFIIIGALA